MATVNEQSGGRRMSEPTMRTEWGIRSNCDGTHKGPMSETEAREWVKSFPKAYVLVSRQYSRWASPDEACAIRVEKCPLCNLPRPQCTCRPDDVYGPDVRAEQGLPVTELRPGASCEETFIDENNVTWTRPTAWSFAQACKALDEYRTERDSAREEIGRLKALLLEWYNANYPERLRGTLGGVLGMAESIRLQAANKSLHDYCSALAEPSSEGGK